MKPDFESVREIVLQQNEENKVFSNNNPMEVALMVQEEASELVSELENAFLTDDLTSVAGEIGDLFYLLIRLGDLLGIALLNTVVMKVKRNVFKYRHQQSVNVAKIEWAENGGDKWFYQEYLDNLAETN
jgi:NTP pyrophosphatase (non-canonical NTP hydrolase)